MLLRSGALKKTIPVPCVALLALWFGHSATAPAGENSMNVQCRIQTTENSNFVRLDAIAVSPVTAAGTYRFLVLKRNTSGSSQNLQSGRFALMAGHEEILTTVVLEAAAHNAYEASLEVESDKGTVTCTAP